MFAINDNKSLFGWGGESAPPLGGRCQSTNGIDYNEQSEFLGRGLLFMTYRRSGMATNQLDLMCRVDRFTDIVKSNL